MSRGMGGEFPPLVSAIPTLLFSFESPGGIDIPPTTVLLSEI